MFSYQFVDEDGLRKWRIDLDEKRQTPSEPVDDGILMWKDTNKVDHVTIDGFEVQGAVSYDYSLALNKPTINGVVVENSKSLSDYGIASSTVTDLLQSEIDVERAQRSLVDGQLSDRIDTKQDVLIAGDNIVINGNTISAAPTGSWTVDYNYVTNKPTINGITLEGALDSEVDLNIYNKTSVDSLLNIETTNRVNADTDLRSRTDANATEITNIKNDYATKTELQTETSERSLIDGQLSDRIDAIASQYVIEFTDGLVGVEDTTLQKTVASWELNDNIKGKFITEKDLTYTEDVPYTTPVTDTITIPNITTTSPIASISKIIVAGAIVLPGTGYTCDLTTGVVTLLLPPSEAYKFYCEYKQTVEKEVVHGALSLNGFYNQDTGTVDTNTVTSECGTAMGIQTVVTGRGAVAEGHYTEAIGVASHSEGFGTSALGKYQHTLGKYNVKDTEEKYVFIIGNGESSLRQNALAVDWKGNVYIKGRIYQNSSYLSTGGTTVAPIPDAPTTDGTYVLKATVVSGVVTYTWVAA